MGTFALDTNSSSGDIIEGLNYAIANLGQGIAAATANVLVANVTTGQITTTSTNNSGYTNTTIVSYLYQYMDVKYANSSTGGSGFSSNSSYKSYYGLRNTANTTISSNPVDYVWYQVTGGFGTTKSLWYQTIGGRQVAFFAGNTGPDNSFISVPDSTPLNLDTVTSAQNNQIVNVNAYYQANTAPATPSGGTYNFSTYTLTPPTGWLATIPGFVANTNIYISQAAFVGNTSGTAGPATLWTVPAIYSAQFNGNTGATGQRGFVPLGYVVTPSDPTTSNTTVLTNWFSASRGNPSPPIGLGYTPIANDTAQFFYQDLFNPNNDVTLVKTFDGNIWSNVTAQVVSGGLIVPGTITANTINTNQVYTLTIQSTNATFGNTSSLGYWLDNQYGDARFGGNVSIGANLNVTNLITFGNLSNNTVGTGQIIAGSITGNLIQGNTIQGSSIIANTITATQIAAGTITGNNIAGNTITGTNIQANTFQANTIQGSSIVAGSITATQLQANLLTVGNIVSTNATIEVPTGAGYWLDYTNGNVYFGGTTQIGTNLIVGNNAVIGGFATIGSNVSIGGGLNVTGLITGGGLNASTVNTTNIVSQAVSLGNAATSTTNITVANPVNNANYFYTYANVSVNLASTYGITNYISGVLATDITFNYTGGGTTQTWVLTFWLFRNSTAVVAQTFRYDVNSANQSRFNNIVPFAYLDSVLSAGTTYTYSMAVSVSPGSTSVPQLLLKSGTLISQILKR